MNPDVRPTRTTRRVSTYANTPRNFAGGNARRKAAGLTDSRRMTVEYRVQQLKLDHMYDIVNGIAPDYMSNLLEIPPSLETVLYHLPFHKFQLQV